ncbi:hypothetical protein ACVWXM_001294 [Bradyrhizobium sp. GM7.3]
MLVRHTQADIALQNSMLVARIPPRQRADSCHLPRSWATHDLLRRRKLLPFEVPFLAKLAERHYDDFAASGTDIGPAALPKPV